MSDERTLPPPLIDPDDLLVLVPGLDPQRAADACALATLAINAATWPNVIPAPPPAPVQAVGLALAARIAGSVGARGGQLVSESLGSYSYRFASPLPADMALLVTDELRAALEPWTPQKSVAMLDTFPVPPAWPYDWFQRDLDNVKAAVDDALISGDAQGPE